MTKPQFSMAINLGHLLQIASLIVAATVGWMTMDARTTANKAAIEGLATERVKDEARLRVLENTAARSDERLQSIFGLLNRIDSRLERIENNETR